MSFVNFFRRVNNKHFPSKDLDLDFQDGQIWHQLERMQLYGQHQHQNSGAGIRPSRRRRLAMDFREHRKYTAGDDLRYVDWKASARQEAVFIRQGEQNQDLSVYIMLDCSESMSWGKPPKYNTAARLTAILSYLTLAHGDRLTIIPFGGKQTPFSTTAGKGQFPNTLKYLKTLNCAGQTNLLEDMRLLSAKYSRGGLVVILSDLLDQHNLNDTLALLHSAKWQVIVIHLMDQNEISPQVRGSLELYDIETGNIQNFDISEKAIQKYQLNFQNWRKQQEDDCIKNEALYTFINTSQTTDLSILAQLRESHIILPI